MGRRRRRKERERYVALLALQEKGSLDSAGFDELTNLAQAMNEPQPYHAEETPSARRARIRREHREAHAWRRDQALMFEQGTTA